jgi:hypothetical protein
MIHESRIDKYLSSGGKDSDTLDKFIKEKGKEGIAFGLNKGFVVVSEKATLAEAKSTMDEIKSCQDIFVTKDGKPDDPMTGWISNIRLAKFLQA